MISPSLMLSQHISLAEFTASETAARQGIDNTLPQDLLINAKATAAMLEAIRAHLSRIAGRDVPIIVSSGYRCRGLNRVIGSKDSSDHVQAQAADFRAPAFGTPTEIAKTLSKPDILNSAGIGQLINEYPDGNGWVHVSVRQPLNLNNRVITITRAATRIGIWDR